MIVIKINRKGPCRRHINTRDDFFGVDIKRARENLGWTHERLIKEARLNDGSRRIYTAASIRLIESGPSIPSADVIAKLAEALQLDLRSLFASAKTILFERYIKNIEGKYCKAYEKYKGSALFHGCADDREL